MYEQSSSSELSSSHQAEEASRRRDRKYVKVINTLEPSQASASVMTHKTKVRSAYNSAIYYSKSNVDDMNKEIAPFNNDDADARSRLK